MHTLDWATSPRQLEKAYQQHFNAMTALKVDPVYDPLRDDPRFQELLRRVGFAPSR
jgi:hypothetical protein